MERSGANAYIYGALSGMLGKSYVGAKASRLFDATSLSDLWQAVFGTEVPLIPQMMLAQKIETEAEKRFIKQYTALIGMYDKVAPLLLELLRFYDVQNLKEMGAALCSGEKERPPIVDLGNYKTLNYDAWPNIARVTGSSPFEWYNKVPGIHEQQYTHLKLDNQYASMLWEAVHKVPRAIRAQTVDFFKNEAIMNNISWALRLKVYYNMDRDEVIKHLSYAKEAKETDEIAGPAIKMLGWESDSWEKWSEWKYASLLNPHEGDTWTVDPRWVENASRQRQYKAALRLFHAEPLTELSVVAWFRIKQRECDLIRTAAERIKLSVDSADAIASAGIGKGV